MAGLIALQLVISAASVLGRNGSSHGRALIRSVPPLPTTVTTVVDTTTAAPAPPPTAPPTTARQDVVPAPPTDANGRLAARLDAALTGVGSCLVIDDGPTNVYSRAAGQALAPASTQKLLVAAAALDQLGPDFHFVTTVVASAPPKNGSVDDLWLVGGGDPMLATPEYVGYLATQARTVGAPLTPMSGLADGVAAAGIHSVKSGIHGDDSRYEALRWLPGWKPIYRDEADVSPLSALTVDGGLDQWKPTETVTADPTALAAARLSGLLGARGVNAPAAAPGTRPASGVVVAQLPSQSLALIVASMLRSSDNLAAELIVPE